MWLNTRYADGTPIPLITSDIEWSNLENNNSDKAYCWVNNNINNKEIFGALYTYATVVNGDNTGINVQGVCPDGWHIPSENEIDELYNYLHDIYGVNYGGGSLKEIGTDNWLSPNTNATNETMFTSVPSGLRSYNEGAFLNFGQSASYHISSEQNEQASQNFGQSYQSGEGSRGYAGKSSGRSCRCIKD